MYQKLVCKKKYLSWVYGVDRKICHSGSLFGITRQASWCRSVTLVTDFSIHTIHTWKILIFLWTWKYTNSMEKSDFVEILLVVDCTPLSTSQTDQKTPIRNIIYSKYKLIFLTFREKTAGSKCIQERTIIYRDDNDQLKYCRIHKHIEWS